MRSARRHHVSRRGIGTAAFGPKTGSVAVDLLSLAEEHPPLHERSHALRGEQGARSSRADLDSETDV